MIKKRIIPCLDVKDGRVVKGKNFTNIADVENPVTLAKYYNESGADELVFYDITASYENRKLFADILRAVAAEIFIPLTVGGGINTLEDFDMALKNGADKVSVNSGAIKEPSLVQKAAQKYGSQCVILSMDVKKVGNNYHVFSKGGREDTGIDAVAWAVQGVKNGAGELVINSIDTDGVKKGFDLPLLKVISDNVNVPIIASGGAGSIAHFVELFTTLPTIDASLAASVFHYKEIAIKDLKNVLHTNNIPVRL